MLSYALLTVLAVAGASLASVVRTPPPPGEKHASNRVIPDDELFSTQVSLQYRRHHTCGASILNSEWVMTGAQCVGSFSMSDLSILAGSDRLDIGGSVHQLKRVIMHPDFSFLTARNDIAVLQVSPPLSIDETRRVIKLPGRGQLIATNSTATFVGWGQSMVGDKMKKISVSVMDQEQCVKVYSEFFYRVSDSQVCINIPEGRKDKCYGDAGHPLFVDDVVVGLASWSDGCPVSGTPSVFTRVSSYRSWIKEQTGV
ncbi:trypsin-1 [Anabrus simplex]|uniref:trypsin-1 n=1 Tax=Anabrus simplex TaxID=316456 RepID=UPI0035A33DE1